MSKEDKNTIAQQILLSFHDAINLSEKDILSLLKSYNKKLNSRSPLEFIEKGSVLVVGDIHGDFEIMKTIVDLFLNNKKTIDHLIFLGDIVDRGSHSIACANLLIALLYQYPQRVHIVRGNHEAVSVNSRYGFLQDIRAFTDGSNLYDEYNTIFAKLPVALVHRSLKLFFVHGGIPISPCSLEDISKLPKDDMMLDNPIIKQLLWNDPQENISRSSYSMRGLDIYTFGSEIVSEFLEKNDLRMIIRAHEAFPEGYKYFFDKKLLSLFTSEEYYSYISAKVAFINRTGEIDIFHPNDKKKIN